MSVGRKRLLLVLFDLATGGFSLLLALVVRYGLEGGMVHPEALILLIRMLPLLIVTQVFVYHLFGLYSQVWAHASVPELMGLTWAAATNSVITGLLIYLWPVAGVPRSIPVIAWLFNLAWLGASRMVLRTWSWRLNPATSQGNPTLIAGAGSAGALLARELAQHPELGYRLIGFIDDDPTKQGLILNGKPVLGRRQDLGHLVQKHGITQMIIALPSAGQEVVRRFAEAGIGAGLHVKRLPGLYELVNGKVTLSAIREVKIEELLGRTEVRTDLVGISHFLADETVLVTGAGGSIGSELCRQVAEAIPRCLLLLGHGENSIYEIDIELHRDYPNLSIIPIIADVQDERRIDAIFAQYRPSIVFHAAAHKHVPLMEQNPTEAIKNNLFGTLSVAMAAHRYQAKRFVLISTDKAVNPTSVMGATKRAAELLVQSMAARSSTVYVAVRFGNVLGSRGSVIPLFKRQIAAGGPITITDARMMRYFMTIPEAVHLVIQAAGDGHGGEIFVLDMGKPVRILDLARELVRRSGLEPDRDIAIICTGIRPGEKLYEELLTRAEGTQATRHQRIFIAPGAARPWPKVEKLITELREIVETQETAGETILGVVQELERSGPEEAFLDTASLPAVIPL